MRAELTSYFDDLDAILEPLGIDAKIRLLGEEASIWARREVKLRKAAARDSANPFLPPLTAWDCSNAMHEISRRLDALREDMPPKKPTHDVHYADLAALKARAPAWMFEAAPKH